MGEPEDIAPMVMYLISDRGRPVTGQVYTCTGRRVSVWNQPADIRSIFAPGSRWNVNASFSTTPTASTKRLPALHVRRFYAPVISNAYSLSKPVSARMPPCAP